jgi:hypothetical protein
MPYSVVDKPSKYFNTKLYTGTGSSNSLTGVGFQPDWVWIKKRNGAVGHRLYDAVRGVQNTLYSSDSASEGTGQSTTLTAFNSDGFTVISESGVNASGDTYVAWNWLGANTTVSNTSGTITSTVSANTTSGFSVGTYTGNSTSDATIGHGLGVAPNMVIVKNRSGADNWQVYWNDGTERNGFLNLTNAFNTPASTSVWGNNNPTSSVFYVGNDSATNTSNNYVFYAFTSIKGYSKFGSYTGNGSTDGTFVYTGFKPAFIIIKRNEAGYDWHMHDNKRDTSNVVKNRMSPNDVFAESTNIDLMDFTSNGFKLRTTTASWNGSGATWIYMCFAENPFVSSKGIPTTAR